MLIADDVGSKTAIAGPAIALGVAFDTDSPRDVEDNGESEDIVLTAELQECTAIFLVDVGGVDHRGPTERQALVGYEPQQLERIGIIRRPDELRITYKPPPAELLLCNGRKKRERSLPSAASRPSWLSF